MRATPGFECPHNRAPERPTQSSSNKDGGRQHPGGRRGKVDADNDAHSAPDGDLPLRANIEQAGAIGHRNRKARQHQRSHLIQRIGQIRQAPKRAAQEQAVGRRGNIKTIRDAQTTGRCYHNEDAADQGHHQNSQHDSRDGWRHTKRKATCTLAKRAQWGGLLVARGLFNEWRRHAVLLK